MFGRKGYKWDVGIHAIGAMGPYGSLPKKIMDWLSAGEIKWAPFGSP